MGGGVFFLTFRILSYYFLYDWGLCGPQLSARIRWGRARSSYYADGRTFLLSRFSANALWGGEGGPQSAMELSSRLFALASPPLLPDTGMERALAGRDGGRGA